MKPKNSWLIAFMAISLSAGFLLLSSSTALAGILEDFDGGGNTPWAFATTSGATPPAILTGGPMNMYARLTYLEASDNRSIAFDENPTMTGPAPLGMRMAFDFRLSDDAANAATGGCCGSAADGMGIGLFATALYGVSGGINPSGADWERPHFPAAFTVGLDIFQNIDNVTINWNGAEIASAELGGVFDLNNSLWHRMIVEVYPEGGNAKVDLSILGDVAGNTSIQQVFSGQPVPGLDLASLPGYRLIAGGRTGGAFAAGDLDNISVESIPEASPMALLSLGAGLFLVRRRTVC